MSEATQTRPVNPEPVFVCECDTPERSLYIVTGHNGDVVLCSYCDDCADLAEMDWNGETAAIEPARPTITNDSTREELIEWLAFDDPNGCWTDEDWCAEGFDPMTLDEAREAYDFAVKEMS